MSLLIKTKWLWIPGIAMLVSSSVTSQFIQSSTSLTGQIGQWHAHHALPAAVFETCCTYRLPGNTSPALFQLTTRKPDTESIPVADIIGLSHEGEAYAVSIRDPGHPCRAGT